MFYFKKYEYEILNGYNIFNTKNKYITLENFKNMS